MLERREYAGFRGDGRVTRDQPRFDLVDIVAGLQPVAQYQRSPEPGELNLEVGITAVVISFDDRDLDAQEPPLAGFAIEKAHGIT